MTANSIKRAIKTDLERHRKTMSCAGIAAITGLTRSRTILTACAKFDIARPMRKNFAATEKGKTMNTEDIIILAGAVWLIAFIAVMVTKF